MSRILGHVDGIEAGCVVGWAVAPGSDRHCLVTLVDGAGQVVGRGRASRPRSDLAVLKLGRVDAAFRLPGLDLDRPGAYRVLADGVELRNSPVVVAPDQFDGRFHLRDGAVVGWVRARSASFAPPLIQIRDQDGRVVAEGRAAAPETASEAASGAASGAASDAVIEASGGAWQGAAVFDLPLADGCFGLPEARLHAHADGVEFAARQCDLRLLGNLETWTAERVGGWLFAPAAPRRRLEVAVAIDGVPVGHAVCAILRGDVGAMHPAAAAPGFALDIPARLRPPAGRLALLSLTLKGGSAELFGGPFAIGGQAPAVEAVRRIARLARGGRLSGGIDGGLDAADAAVLQAMADGYLAQLRRSPAFIGAAPRRGAGEGPIRLNVVIPIYRDVAVTRACVETVLAELSPRDRLILVNDASPDPDMDGTLRGFAARRGVGLLTNDENAGFVRTANRGMAFCRTGDVLLLNSDTRLFAGCLDELDAVAHADPAIGTVTPLSSNATLFTYPHPGLAFDRLDDLCWGELAAVALAANRGAAVDVPTGHGFCLHIKRVVLDAVGPLDEAFGRGYGEENDFCARAADRGYRNVAAAGVLVQHLESVSFQGDKRPLLEANLALLHRRYPDHHAAVMQVLAEDPLRRARWPLDRARLLAAAAAAAGDAARFVLVVQHGQGGGTRRAIDDIGELVGFAGRRTLDLKCGDGGLIALSCERPPLRASFAAGDEGELFALLGALPLDLVVVHQLLGFSAEVVAGFARLAERVRTVYYAHDFYPLCPRVTMIDALGEFCDVAAAPRCAACVGIAGSHPASRLDGLAPDRHRALFAGALGRFARVVAPSESAAGYLRRAFAGLDVAVLPHPERAAAVSAGAFSRVTSSAAGPAPAGPALERIVVLGALGPQKGSAMLREVAARARLTHPSLRFDLIGHTDDDGRFEGLANVAITGRYEPGQLAGHIARSGGRIALFLHIWPETFSYTLSEAVRHGLLPLVPDLGAPAERVRQGGFGAVYPHPFTAATVLGAIDAVVADPSRFGAPGRAARLLGGDDDRARRTAELYALADLPRPGATGAIAGKTRHPGPFQGG